MAPTSVLAEFAKTHKNVATNRGFTGHEMLDEVGIIHMNGRIYDASIGRFLQADPHIDGAGSVGGYNRYSYLKNNPLNGTDPTGYFSLKKELKNGWNKVRPLVGAIVGIALAVWMPWDGGFGAMVAYGAIAGGAGAAANGGNLSDVIRGAAIGGASAAAFFGVAKAIPSAASAAEAGKNAFRIGKNAWMTAGNFAKLVVAQGMVGGVMSVLQGGKFGHGFASAGISKLATPGILSMDNVVAESIASGMVDGTVSKATGGKFANGATTAAFLYAFNAGSTAVKDAQKGQVAVDKALDRLRSEVLRMDGKDSESYKNALKMTGTFDESYSGVAVIDGKSGKAIFGRQFLNPSASDEMSVDATKYFNSLSTSDRQLFVVRHELEHMSAHNLSIQRNYQMQGIDTDRLPRYRNQFEIDATNKTYNWMKGR